MSVEISALQQRVHEATDTAKKAGIALRVLSLKSRGTAEDRAVVEEARNNYHCALDVQQKLQAKLEKLIDNPRVIGSYKACLERIKEDIDDEEWTQKVCEAHLGHQ